MFESASFALASREVFLLVFANLMGLTGKGLLFSFAFFDYWKGWGFFKKIHKLVRHVFILLRTVFHVLGLFSFIGVLVFIYISSWFARALYIQQSFKICLEVIGGIHTFSLVFHIYCSFFLRTWLASWFDLWFWEEQKRVCFLNCGQNIIIFRMIKFKNIDLRLYPITGDHSLALVSLA